MANNQTSSEEGNTDPNTSSSSNVVNLATENQPVNRKIAHKHHHKPGHGKIHYKHHHHHQCCGRKESHSCVNKGKENSSREEEDQKIETRFAPHSATFGEFDKRELFDDDEDDITMMTPYPDREGNKSGVKMKNNKNGVSGAFSSNVGDEIGVRQIYNPPHTAPLRMMSDPEQFRQKINNRNDTSFSSSSNSSSSEAIERLRSTTNSRNLLNPEGRQTPAPSYSNGIGGVGGGDDVNQNRISSLSASTISSFTETSSQYSTFSKRKGLIVETPLRKDTPLVVMTAATTGGGGGANGNRNYAPIRSETMTTNSSNETFGQGKQIYVATNPLLDTIVGTVNSNTVIRGSPLRQQTQTQSQQQSPPQKVRFEKLQRVGTISSSDYTSSDNSTLRAPIQAASTTISGQQINIDKPTRSPFRHSNQSRISNEQNHNNHNNNNRHFSGTSIGRNSRHDSYTSYGSDLQNRDKRISVMIEDCFTPNVMTTINKSQNEQALRKRVVNGKEHHPNNKRESGFIDQILGFDKITPGDLIYGEGSKIDGSFGFTIPSGIARESTILLDSREDHHRIKANIRNRHPISSSTTRNSDQIHHQSYFQGGQTNGRGDGSHINQISDSNSGSSRFSSDTESIASTISNLIFNRKGGGGTTKINNQSDHQNNNNNDVRASTSSFGSGFASISNRFRRPSSLSDRVNDQDLRPKKLDLNKRGARGGGGNKFVRESSTSKSESDSKSSATWEDVQLDNNSGHGKNERLANAVGARLPLKKNHHHSRGEESLTNSSDLTVIEEEEDQMEGEEDEPKEARENYQSGFNGDTDNHFRSGYTEREVRPTYISGASDSDGFRATMNLPPGLSQADIVAICLVQGMVPPGLPPDDTLVSWSGPLSPTNPRNWSTFSKWYACILVSWSTFLANAATNMIAPALGLMSVEYKILYTMWIRGSLIGSYIFAFTFAPLIFGPMSEIMGRKPVLIIGSSLFAIACLLSGFVTSVWQLMILRFLSALGASAPMSIGGAVLTDIFSPDQRGRAMTLFALAPQFGPVLGPIAGGWITQEAKKWRWIFFTAAICGFTAAIPMIFVRESYTPRILANRAKKLRKETGNDQLTTIFERRQETKKQIITRGVVRPLVLFSCEPLVQLLTAYVSLIYGIIHLMVATFPAVFGTIYSEAPGWASMHFINIGIGTIAGGFAGGYLVEKHYHNLSLKNRGVAKPEFKFYCMLYTVWIPPFGLLGYGLMTWYGIHWIFADFFIFIFCFGISIAVVAVQSYMVDCYALLAGSALTATIVFRSIVGTGATIGSEDLLLHAGMLWSNVALAGACVFIGVPCAYAVYFWGASMRQKSRHATHKR